MAHDLCRARVAAPGDDRPSGLVLGLVSIQSSRWGGDGDLTRLRAASTDAEPSAVGLTCAWHRGQ
jgi:hypothetical protein